MRISVVGLGKLGLPLAGFYLAAGHKVVGSDVSDARLRAIAALDADVAREPELVDALQAGRLSGRWHATKDTAEAVGNAEIVVVIVPVHATAVDRIDLSTLDGAIEQISRGLPGGATVIIESTVPAGTTRRRALPALEDGGRRQGKDFWLAYSPERVSVGAVFRDLRTYPKIVGGVDVDATARAASFYRDGLGLETWEVANAETAEFTKLIETTYRDANIGLANAFARAADAIGVDAVEAIRSANSQPYSHIHMPGVGVGGNCIPVYPYLYAASTPVGTELALHARALNDEMVDYSLERLAAAYGGPLAGARVLVLGVTYRPGVKETANSPALRLATALRAAGAVPLAADPLLSAADLERFGFVAAQPPAYAPADAVIVQCLDPVFADLVWIRSTGARVVLDGRNVLDPDAVREAGAAYVGIGR